MKCLRKSKDSQAGFTLVELAIVMIIIGLLIGGILKGQELVANARVTATVAQIKSLDGAMSTFVDKYNALPGDMNNSGNRLRGCTGNCATASNGDGQIRTGNLGRNMAGGIEEYKAFLHLAAGDLISGVDPNRAVAPNGNSPLIVGDDLLATEIGTNGHFRVGFTINGNADGGLPNGTLRAGHYLALASSAGTSVANANAAYLTPTQASQIDFKLDDGVPTTGNVQPARTVQCIVGTAYNEAAAGAARCALYVRVQG
jgi:prepilin-type N-terminal cleavage/methylation domain-containing protein